MTLVRELEGLLWPERFPPGHERHDPDHEYWESNDAEDGVPFQWDAGTIEAVAEIVDRAAKAADPKE